MKKEDETATATTTTTADAKTEAGSKRKEDAVVVEFPPPVPVDAKGKSVPCRRLVKPNWDRFLSRSVPGQRINMYGHNAVVQANGDAICDVPLEADQADNEIKEGRLLPIEDYTPLPPPSDEQKKDAQLAARMAT